MIVESVKPCIQWFIYNFWLMNPRTPCFSYQRVQLQTYESRIFFNDKSAILLHPLTRRNKNFASQRQNDAQKMHDGQVTKSPLYSNCLCILFNLALWHWPTFYVPVFWLWLKYIYDFNWAGVTQRSLRTNVMLVYYNVLSISKQDEAVLLSCVCHNLKWLACMWDTITCLRQSGIPKDHEN